MADEMSNPDHSSDRVKWNEISALLARAEDEALQWSAGPGSFGDLSPVYLALELSHARAELEWAMPRGAEAPDVGPNLAGFRDFGAARETILEAVNEAGRLLAGVSTDSGATSDEVVTASRIAIIVARAVERATDGAP